MYLGGKKVKSVGFEHPLFGIEPPKGEVNDADLLRRLRAKEPGIEDVILKSFVRLILTVVGRYYALLKKRDDELVSAALLGFTKAIRNAPERMKDDNLGGYIIRNVHGYIEKYLRKQVKHETLDDWETPDTVFFTEDWIKDVSLNDMEINILRLRSRGWRNSEIAEHLGVSRKVISQSWLAFKRRFDHERQSEVGS